jgi:hypothetical protein
VLIVVTILLVLCVGIDSVWMSVMAVVRVNGEKDCGSERRKVKNVLFGL